MSDTPSPTPSEDNRRNVRDETASLAIDSAFKNMEQSREDLLNSFTFLKKVDVENTKPKPAAKGSDHQVMKSVMSNLMRLENQKVLTNHMKKLSLDDSKSINDGVRLDHDGIEEEVLEDGNMACRLSSARVIRTGTNVKVDNFVDEEDIEDIRDRYVASFEEEKTYKSTTVGTKTSEMDTKTNKPDFASSLSIDENSTDKLLLNFLADLQNEQNEQKIPERTETLDSASSIDAFIQKNKKQEEEVDFSQDGDDAAMSLVDNINTDRMEIAMNQDKFDEIKKLTSSKEIQIQRKDMFKALKDDHVTNGQGQPDACDKVSDIVFPGEIVDEECLTGTTNNRLLEFKVIYRNPSETPDSATENESGKTSCDEVEPFQLDTDFDYDNVVLTPKFSEADMERLKTLLTTGATAVV